MRYGFDAAFAPDFHTLSSWRQLGYDFFLGYLGGRAVHTWTKEEWQSCAAAGFEVAGYWVAPSTDLGLQRGVDDGNACLSQMMSLGMSGIALVDIEDGAVQDEYLYGFKNALAAGQCSMGVYGSSPTLYAAFDLGIEFYTVLAAWSPFGSTVRRALPDWHVWQYGGNSEVDYNVAREDMLFASIGAS